MRTIEQIMRSLIADVEAMQRPKNEYWYGGFEDWTESEEGFLVNVYWPNLTILIDEAKQIIGARNNATSGDDD